MEQYDNYVTKIGKAFLSERVVMHGRNIHKDASNMDYFKFWLFSITGREVSDKYVDIMQHIFKGTSYPDVSIWPNTVNAYCGSTRTSPNMAFAAGVALGEATLYGRKAELKSFKFFEWLGKNIDGISVETLCSRYIKENKKIFGYGIPLRNKDERINHAMTRINELGLNEGKYVQLMLRVQEYLRREKGIGMTIVAPIVAVSLDEGLSETEFKQLMITAFSIGTFPCFSETNSRQEGGFFPVKCADIENEDKTTCMEWK